MLGLQLYNYTTSKLIKDPIYLGFCRCEGVRSSKSFPKESHICKCFWKWCFVHTCGQHFILYFFSLSECNLHAASILQSIVLNRLQCELLSLPLSLSLTDCGSPAALNHIQVSVHVDACCHGVKEAGLTWNPNLSLMSRHVMQNIWYDALFLQ